MADSDVDSLYDWKGRANFTEMPYGSNVGTSRDDGLSDSNYLTHLTSDNSRKGNTRINGLIQCHTVPTSSRSGPEVRFINPAIYAESLPKGDEEHEVQIRLKVQSADDVDGRRCNGQVNGNCGDSTEMNDLLSTLSIKNDGSVIDNSGDQASRSAQETYRCYSSHSATTPSLRAERRCRIEDQLDKTYKDVLHSARQSEPEVQRYTLNGHRVVQISTTSLSSSSISESRLNGVDLARKIAHDEWVRKKQVAVQRKKKEESLAERRKQAEIDRLTREKEEREYRERESFLRWTERKRKEEEKKKASIDRELELQKRLKDIEDKAAVAKALYLRQWNRKKKEEEKARQKKQEIKQKQVDEERQKRLEESTRAYEKWRHMSRNKPKPATQGLLPHQKAKPAYVNPTPWQQILDDTDDTRQDVSNSKKNQNQGKIINRKSITPYQ